MTTGKYVLNTTKKAYIYIGIYKYVYIYVYVYVYICVYISQNAKASKDPPSPKYALISP